jgi:HK97 family phage prohead protease
MATEKRALPGVFEVSAGRTLVGYGAVWDSPAQIAEGGRSFTEVIRRGAFRTAIESKGDVIATFNHDPSRLLGRTSSGTLRLHEDERGLRFELDLPDHAADVKEMVSRGDLRGASFTFSPRRGGETWDGSLRTLTDVYLYELGPVAMPAYPATSVGLRSKVDWLQMQLDLLAKT